MPIGTAFHPRTAALCETLSFREWSGYYAVSAYETHHEHEYTAIRNAAALIDISPLFKYRISGQDATKLVNRVMTRDVSRMRVGQVWYTTWCDDAGKVIDDGTVSRLGEDVYRVTAADPSLRWFHLNALGLGVTIEDVSEVVAALALQGPASAGVLRAVADVDVDGLRYFRVVSGHIAGVPVEISRTGYTGDLGYEIWIPSKSALDVWDALVIGGRAFDLRPAGMIALDIARVEAGLLLIDVDFQSSRKAYIETQKYTPYEMGLGRLVELDKERFIGRRVLAEGYGRGTRRMIVGLDLDWHEVETLYDRVGLAPVAPAVASRTPVPVTRQGRQIGRATTTAWSPTLKRLIALATIDAPHFAPGTRVNVEVTVEAKRHHVSAEVVKTPFFSPPRKTAATPA